MVTARPAHFMPLPSGRAASMVASGQPITQSPSMSDWVESEPSFSRSSSEITLSEAFGPFAMPRDSTGATPRASAGAAAREASGRSELATARIMVKESFEVWFAELEISGEARLCNGSRGHYVKWPGATSTATTIRWARRLRARPGGAPDGTGLRTTFLLACHAALPLLARWLDMLSSGLLTPAHRRLLATKTVGGQCKPLRSGPNRGSYPALASEAEAARPLCRHNVIRRHIARAIARTLGLALRPAMIACHQFGACTAGCDLTARRLQLLTDLSPACEPADPVAHAPLDVANAHSEISRLAVRGCLAADAAAAGAHPSAATALRYFDLFYSFPGTAFVLLGGTLVPHAVTRALDQGDGLANPFFNRAFSPEVGAAIAPIAHAQPRLLPAPTATLLHDDTTISGYCTPPPRPLPPAALAPLLAAAAAVPPSPDLLTALAAHVPPLLAAILLLESRLARVLDLQLAPQKTHLFHPLLSSAPALAPALRPYLHPEARLEPLAFVVGGVAVGLPAGVAAHRRVVRLAQEACAGSRWRCSP